MHADLNFNGKDGRNGLPDTYVWTEGLIRLGKVTFNHHTSTQEKNVLGMYSIQRKRLCF